MSSRRKRSRKRPKCIEPSPVSSAWTGQYDVDNKSTKSKFKNIRKWVRPHSKPQRLSGWICNVAASDHCSSSFNDRKKLDTIKSDGNHHIIHKNESKPYRKVSEFIVYRRDNCLFDDGTTKQMMMIIGEKKIKQQPTINAYFTKKEKEEETEDDDDDDVIMNDIDG